MDKDISRKYHLLIIGLGQLLSISRLYNSEHPVFKEKAKQVLAKIDELMTDQEPLTLSELEGVLLINGEKIGAKEPLIRHFVEGLHDLRFGSISLEPGLSVEELVLLINIMSHKIILTQGADIKEYLKQKGAKHIIPRLAIYKLVEEDEKIVKEKDVISVGADDIPMNVISAFSEDLKKGEVGERLKKKEKGYLVLAHDPKFLSSLALGLAKDINSPEEVAKILWLIGDYLIGEIGTVREEELNRKIMRDLKDHLVETCEKKEYKPQCKEEIEKTVVAISASLELKALMLLYQKHKKEIEAVVKKIADILNTMPPESRIYGKTKEYLEKIGPPSLEMDLFGKEP